jgi:glycosyltransferase involved in cell wall biosynthesis
MLPFYGRFDHLRAAVDSVIAQTDTDWRLTVVDDVYPDPAPGDWVRSLEDPRILYLRNEVNLGVSGNYLRCVELMQDDFGVLFGCDDVMLPGYVARVKELLAAHSDAAVVQPGVEVIDDDGRVYRPLVDRIKGHYRVGGSGIRVLVGEDLAVSLLRGNWTYFPALVWRVETLRRFGFHPELIVVQDLIMLMDIVADGGTFILDDEVVFQYRRHQHSVSSAMATDGSRFVQERRLFDSERERYERMGWKRAATAARRHGSSKLNALTRIPAALRAGDLSGIRDLVTHAAGRRIRSRAG